MEFLTARFQSVPRMQTAVQNSPPLMKPENSPAVAALQQTLVDLGFAMPISMAKGKPDGIYGDETFRVVRQFQSQNGLKPDGIDFFLFV